MANRRGWFYAVFSYFLLSLFFPLRWSSWRSIPNYGWNEVTKYRTFKYKLPGWNSQPWSESYGGTPVRMLNVELWIFSFLKFISAQACPGLHFSWTYAVACYHTYSLKACWMWLASLGDDWHACAFEHTPWCCCCRCYCCCYLDTKPFHFSLKGHRACPQVYNLCSAHHHSVRPVIPCHTNIGDAVPVVS